MHVRTQMICDGGCIGEQCACARVHVCTCARVHVCTCSCVQVCCKPQVVCAVDAIQP